MAQPLVALGGQQTVAQERDQHPRAEALAQVRRAVGQQFVDLRRSERHMGPERSEPDRDEVTVGVAPPAHRPGRVGAVLAHRAAEQRALRATTRVPPGAYGFRWPPAPAPPPGGRFRPLTDRRGGRHADTVVPDRQARSERAMVPLRAPRAVA